MRIPKLLLLLSGLLASCGQSQGQANTLVASFYPIAFLAQQIAGDQFEVQCLTPAGSEPHDFNLTPRGRAALEDAKAIFINGLGMEVWADSLDDALRAKTTDLSYQIPTLQIEGRTDPHIWLSTENYRKMGQAVMDKLVAVDPSHASVYQSNFVSFTAKIQTLKDRCEELSASFGEKTIAVSHAAYGYLCQEYGIEQLYINGLSPSEEPQAQSLGKIIDAMTEKGIDTIFFEELVSPEIAEYIASQTGAKVESLNPLESLEQEDIDAGEDYFSVYWDNMTKIARTKP